MKHCILFCMWTLLKYC